MVFLPPRLPDAAPRDETTEMILLTLARAEETGSTLSRDDLARELGCAPDPYVQALICRSLIVGAADELALTPAGRAHARALLRRHRLVERHLTDVLGFDWTRAHEQADKLEHHVPVEDAQTLADQLGNPATCPHGNPIPHPDTDAAPLALIPLADCVAQTGATIARINAETPDALHHLATLGLLPDVEIEIENQAPFGGPVMVRIGRAHYALGRDLAARIWVKEIQNPDPQFPIRLGI